MRTNWAGNTIFQARELLAPRSVEELQQLVRGAEQVRALGSRHSFNDIADSPGAQVSLRHLCGMELDETGGTVTVGGGVTYAQLAPWLDARGYALHNLASLPHITIAGAVQTGTHGSGLGLGSLATAVTTMDLVTADGELVRVSPETRGKQFEGAVVALGALGIVASLTLRMEPSYRVRQDVWEDLPLRVLETGLREVFASGYSVSLFADWNERTIPQVWVKSRIGASVADLRGFGARPATRERHPLPDLSAENCTPQMGVPGPWHERLPHFRASFTPSNGDELQTEYFVPFSQGWAAIQSVVALGKRIAPLLFASEMRAVAADALWLSPCYERASLALHFTWKPDWPRVREVLPELEAALAPFGARPHWGKMFTMEPEGVRRLYPKLEVFRSLCHRFDPQGKFMNDLLAKWLIGRWLF